MSQQGEENIHYSPEGVKEPGEYTEGWLRYIYTSQDILSGKSTHILLHQMEAPDRVQKQNNRISKAQCPSEGQPLAVWQQRELLIHPLCSTDTGYPNTACRVLQHRITATMFWLFSFLHGMSPIRIFTGIHLCITQILLLPEEQWYKNLWTLCFIDFCIFRPRINENWNDSAGKTSDI